MKFLLLTFVNFIIISLAFISSCNNVSTKVTEPDLVYVYGKQRDIKNRRQAQAFWKSWQNLETGRLYKPLYQDPQHLEVKPTGGGWHRRPDKSS